jgi:hypothetical protein
MGVTMTTANKTPSTPTMTDDQLRLYIIALLTAAANALAMGGSADQFAQQKMAEVTPALNALVPENPPSKQVANERS